MWSDPAAAPAQRFTPLHQQTLQAILEPLAAALENDHRLRELTALREAAEADKQSLLRRLGRTAVTETIVGADGRLRPVMERCTGQSLGRASPHLGGNRLWKRSHCPGHPRVPHGQQGRSSVSTVVRFHPTSSTPSYSGMRKAASQAP